MTDVSYGELVDRAGCWLARATATRTDPGDPAELTRLAVGLDLVRAAVRRHADLAADPWQGNTPTPRQPSPIYTLAEELRPSWLPADPPGGGTVDPVWRQIAGCLGAAGDLLATHLGPHGRPLTYDAGRIVSPAGRAQLARHAAWFADTAASYAAHLAHQAAPGPHDEFLNAVVTLWCRHSGQVRSAAHHTLHDTAPAAGHDLLRGLTPVPLLRAEPVTDLDGALRAYDRLRRLAHAQTVGDRRADTASLRGFAALGYTITGHAHLAHAAVGARAADLGLDPAVGDRHRDAADRLRQATTAWGALHAALAYIRDAGGAPIGWRDDILGIRDHLDRLLRPDRRPPSAGELVPDLVTARALLAVVNRFTTGLPDIAAGQGHCARRLHHAGQLHIPTRQLLTGDIPRPYAPLPPGRFDALLAAYTMADASTREALATEGVWTPRRADPPAPTIHIRSPAVSTTNVNARSVSR